MANCKLEDRIETRMLLDDEIPILDNSNNTIVYDLPQPSSNNKEQDQSPNNTGDSVIIRHVYAYTTSTNDTTGPHSHCTIL
jgi:hypothetical protein